MSIFDHRKPVGERTSRDSLATLRKTLEHLEAEPDETQRIADLKRILAGRIAEMERKTGLNAADSQKIRASSRAFSGSNSSQARLI